MTEGEPKTISPLPTNLRSVPGEGQGVRAGPGTGHTDALTLTLSQRERGPQSRPRRRWARWLFRQIEHCLALIGLGTILFFTCFNLSRVISDSMAPTLRGHDWRSGDLVLTEKVSYWFRGPRRWEVVTFRSSDGVQVMKRVVGLPGEHVQIRRGGQIVIDGRPIEQPAELSSIHYFPIDRVIADKSVACGEGYFVLGDHTFDSDDSRYNDPMRPDQVIGRSWLIVGPSGRRGFVNP
jgi:signal peptidase I